MELSELTAYAEEKFHIREQRKWPDLPGFSVMTDPNTGMWVALLMRQWDFDTGTEIQRCDIRCDQQILTEISVPYLSRPFRMKDHRWIGIIFDNRTQPDVVYKLFDRAVRSGEQRGCTIILDNTPSKLSQIPGIFRATALPAGGTGSSQSNKSIPDKIRKMLQLYEYGDNSFVEKCRNFYRQGKFMEDYEDDAPWHGEFRRYFTTYHDLNLRQLRGYFTWRTRLRKGEFLPIATSLAYLYLYELLNGIGVDSPEDALQKMQAFERGFLDSGIGDAGIYKNLHRWMLEYSIIHNFPTALLRQYVTPAILESDNALAILKTPENFTEEEVFTALCHFSEKKLKQSPIFQKDGETGKRLFAKTWRLALKKYCKNGQDLFTACFGKPVSFSWHPLGNAVYWEATPHPDTDYSLNALRIYRCRNGIWQEERYDTLYFYRDLLHQLLHETDRMSRRYLKTGHYLHKKEEEAWASEYVETAIYAEQKSKEKASRPKIEIDLSSLEQIRHDARLTRDSLLIEDETAADLNGVDEINEIPEESTCPAAEDKIFSSPAVPLDAEYRQILLALLGGETADTYLKARRQMPSVVADTINEAFFEEIGDNILECDGNRITVVEDYKEEILQILGGEKQ